MFGNLHKKIKTKSLKMIQFAAGTQFAFDGHDHCKKVSTVKQKMEMQ